MGALWVTTCKMLPNIGQQNSPYKKVRVEKFIDFSE
jgi:hypothetical protein